MRINMTLSFFLAMVILPLQVSCKKKTKEIDEAEPTTPAITSSGTLEITSTALTTAVVGDPIGEVANFDLSTWTPVNLTSSLNSNHVYPDWTFTSEYAVQNVNSIPTVLLSDIDVTNNLIRGLLVAGTSVDDDFIGFVFGYESIRKFYLLDWKRGTQSGANAGISIKRFNATSDPVAEDFWSSAGNGSRMTVLYHKAVPWEYDEEYSFSVNFVPGSTKISIHKGSVEIDEITVTDSIISSGKFGFYNYSQDNVRYDGLVKTPVQGLTYTYQVATNEAEGSSLTFTLAEAPEGMTIDSSTGLITWERDLIVTGAHNVKIHVEDSDGETAEQSYVLSID